MHGFLVLVSTLVLSLFHYFPKFLSLFHESLSREFLRT